MPIADRRPSGADGAARRLGPRRASAGRSRCALKRGPGDQATPDLDGIASEARARLGREESLTTSPPPEKRILGRRQSCDRMGDAMLTPESRSEICGINQAFAVQFARELANRPGGQWFDPVIVSEAQKERKVRGLGPISGSAKREDVGPRNGVARGSETTFRVGPATKLEAPIAALNLGVGQSSPSSFLVGSGVRTIAEQENGTGPIFNLSLHPPDCPVYQYRTCPASRGAPASNCTPTWARTTISRPTPTSSDPSATSPRPDS